MENKAYPGSSAAADHTHQRSQHLSEQLGDITAKVLRFTNAGGAAIAIGTGEVAVTRATAGDLAPDLDTPIRLEGSFAGLCIRQAELLYCEDAENDPRVDASASAAMGLRSMVMVPIGEKGNIHGVLAAFSGMPGAFRPTHIAVLRTLADIVHELIVREEKTHTEPVTQSMRRYEAPAPVPPPSAAAPSGSPRQVFSSEPSFLPDYAGPQSTGSAAAAVRAPENPKVIEIPKPVTPPIVEPVRSEKFDIAEPPVPVIEAPKPVIAPKPVEPPKVAEPVAAEPMRAEPPKPVEPSKTEPVRVAETPKQKEKESLPSIVALANQAKRAEAELASGDANLLPAAADPLTKRLAPSPAAPTKAPAVKVKPEPKEPGASAHKVSSTASFEAPMFHGLDHSTEGSRPIAKYVGIAVLGAVVIAGGIYGIRSLSHRSTQQPAPVQQVTAPTPDQTVQPSSTTPSSTATATPATAAAGGHEVANSTTAASSGRSSSESKPAPETKAAQPRIVADKVAPLPRRNAPDVDAPQLALNNGNGNLGALLAGKASTPTLNVKRSSLSPPEVIRRVPPKFPEIARRTNPAGDRVVLNVTVNKEGRVTNVQTVRGQSIFSEAAVNAVKQWQYRPAFLNGDPVEATVEVVISFTGAR